MANKGVTQEQVNRAADALVTAGERPTVERIRAHLGSGSPNTVTRLLEAWWQELGQRLTAQQAKLALPEAPAEVVALASQWWEQALLAARAEAMAGTEADRQALERERTALAAERERSQQDVAAQQRIVENAQHTLAVTEARLAEIQQLAEQQAGQIRDLTQQRNALHGRSERQDAELIALAERLQQQESTAAAEREAQAQHLRAAEDRAHAEVDRARQEAKELRIQLTTLTRERAAGEQQLRLQREEASVAATAAQREASASRARAETLEQQLAKLVELSSALETTLTQARTGPTTRRSANRAPRSGAAKPPKSSRSRS